MSLEKQIGTFISKVPRGCVFDAHAVIAYLLEKHPDDYLCAHGTKDSMRSFHGRISQEINKFADTEAIERIGNSYSKSLTGRFLKNACWKKL